MCIILHYVVYSSGLIKGDEIMVINGAIVSDLDMMYIESVLQEELSLCMMMRSSRLEPPEVSTHHIVLRTTTDDYIESLVCPPPPSDNVISEEMIDKLIVPSPLYGKRVVCRPTVSVVLQFSKRKCLVLFNIPIQCSPQNLAGW